MLHYFYLHSLDISFLEKRTVTHDSKRAELGASFTNSLGMGFPRDPRMLTLVLGITLGLVFGSAYHAQALLDEFHTNTAGFFDPTLEATASEESLLKSVVDGGHPNPIVPDEPIILKYHKGPILTGNNDQIRVNVIFYGTFSEKQKNILRTFFKSFLNNALEVKGSTPTVAKWWQITRRYTDGHKTPVARSLVPGGEFQDLYSAGKNLKVANIQNIIKKAMKQKNFGSDPRDIYLVLTADDVAIERFCGSACGNHFYLSLSSAEGGNGQQIPYAWIGNPGKQCPSLCAWPYAPGGIIKQALIPPNGDVGIDGMIITIGNLLAGMATNPFGNAWYQDGSGLEGAGVCQGIYGTGSFSGYPGQLLVDKTTKASYNVVGYSNHKFLVPWIWHPTTKKCAGQA
ncbi:hypothetical protein R1sor_014077 [Riccia sorocarpa]|uniref:Uncharacterized protein n=1 Tax=Riccia sorocarpa TaxID=122646 RepID=A0ABD3H8D5_9MARC